MTFKFIKSSIWRVERRNKDGAIIFNRDTKFLGKIKRKLVKTGFCSYCSNREGLQLDHIKPIILGGRDDISNLQLLCKECHLIKTKKDVKLIVKFRKLCDDHRIDRWEDNSEKIVEGIANELYEKKEGVNETDTEQVKRG